MSEDDYSEVYDGLFARFTGGRLSWADPDTGKPIFEMKKKDMADYGSEEIYYIFKVYERNFSSEEKRNEFLTSILPVLKSMAGQMEIPLYDFDEITERANEATHRLRREGIDMESRQVDTKIEVMDHGSGRLQSLTVGIQVGPKALKSVGFDLSGFEK